MPQQEITAFVQLVIKSSQYPEPCRSVEIDQDIPTKDDIDLSDQLQQLSRKAAKLSGPAVIIMPPLTEIGDLETYYSNHDAKFGFDTCNHIFTSVEINSNGDMSPCRDYHDFVVGNVKDQTVTELWNSEPYRKFRLSLSQKGLMPACTRCCGLMGY